MNGSTPTVKKSVTYTHLIPQYTAMCSNRDILAIVSVVDMYATTHTWQDARQTGIIMALQSHSYMRAVKNPNAF